MSRTAILVAGMHRSGTSALTRVLNLLGIPLPDRLVPGFMGNNLGHWEPEEAVQIHDRLFAAAGSDVNDPVGFDPAFLDSAAAAPARAEIRDFLARTFADRTLVAIKDPRICLALPLWQRALAELGIADVYLHPYRPPAEVAASLTRRQTQVFPDSVWPPERGGLLWLRYTEEAERASRGRPRAFLSFEGLLADWRGVADRLARQTGLAWPADPTAAGPAIDTFLDRAHTNERAETGANPLPELDAYLDDLARLEAEPDWTGHRLGDAAFAAPIRRRYLNVHVMTLDRQNLALSARARAPLAPPPIDGALEFEAVEQGLEAEETGTTAGLDRTAARALRVAGAALRAERAQTETLRTALARSETALADAQAGLGTLAAERDGAAAERERLSAERDRLAAALEQERQRRRKGQAALERLRSTPRAALRLALDTVWHGPRDDRGRPWSRAHRRRVAAVLESGLFDASWYRRRYADVDGSEMEPVHHFAAFGSREGRDPGPGFSAARYRAAHPDIDWSTEEPLFHYLREGRREARTVFPSEPEATSPAT